MNHKPTTWTCGNCECVVTEYPTSSGISSTFHQCPPLTASTVRKIFREELAAALEKLKEPRS